jgi:hypothetical protein
LHQAIDRFISRTTILDEFYNYNQQVHSFPIISGTISVSIQQRWYNQLENDWKYQQIGISSADISDIE